jgi:serine/threonine-protein phosphatase 4 regulatory subunit 2
LDALEDFNRKPPEKISDVLEGYLERVARTGETWFPWPKLKPLFLRKLDDTMQEFFENVPTDDLALCPNVENIKFSEMRERLLKAVGEFTGAPFTIQRLCELITNPQKHYKRTDKFLRGIEKNLLVVSTVDPFGNKIVSESKSLVNGLDSNGFENKASPDTTQLSPFLSPLAPSNTSASASPITSMPGWFNTVPGASESSVFSSWSGSPGGMGPLADSSGPGSPGLGEGSSGSGSEGDSSSDSSSSRDSLPGDERLHDAEKHPDRKTEEDRVHLDTGVDNAPSASGSGDESFGHNEAMPSVLSSSSDDAQDGEPVLKRSRLGDEGQGGEAEAKVDGSSRNPAPADSQMSDDRDLESSEPSPDALEREDSQGFDTPVTTEKDTCSEQDSEAVSSQSEDLEMENSGVSTVAQQEGVDSSRDVSSAGKSGCGNITSMDREDDLVSGSQESQDSVQSSWSTGTEQSSLPESLSNSQSASDDSEGLWGTPPTGESDSPSQSQDRMSQKQEACIEPSSQDQSEQVSSSSNSPEDGTHSCASTTQGDGSNCCTSEQHEVVAGKPDLPGDDSTSSMSDMQENMSGSRDSESEAQDVPTSLRDPDSGQSEPQPEQNQVGETPGPSQAGAGPDTVSLSQVDSSPTGAGQTSQQPVPSDEPSSQSQTDEPQRTEEPMDTE